jgi:hypothetical protein
MPKVHKNPMKLQPVVSCINSFPSIFSTWLDFKMKDLLSFIPSYIKNSTELIKDLKKLQLPPGAKVLTSDATSMYTNLDSNTGIQALRDLPTTQALHISPTFPTDFFLLILEIVMNHNIFQFGDTFWGQLQGTAMGTPAAPLYSILTYGQHENTKILQKFKENLIYYKRYIDDIFGIWVDTTEYTWESFKSDLNQFGTLQWNTEKPTTSTTFLDLHIQIDHNRIITKTHQKELNLYLYILSTSAHPASCFKGLITREIIRYWTQNSKHEDFIDITQQFIQRLIQRGHKLQDIIPVLRTAPSTIESVQGNRNPTIILEPIMMTPCTYTGNSILGTSKRTSSDKSMINHLKTMTASYK